MAVVARAFLVAVIARAFLAVVARAFLVAMVARAFLAVVARAFLVAMVAREHSWWQWLLESILGGSSC